MNLADGSRLETIEDLERYALTNMNMADRSIEELAEMQGFTVNRRTVGELVALEIIRAGEPDGLGEKEPAYRALTVLGGDFLFVVVMMNLDGGDAGTPLLWDHMLGSLQVEASGWTLGKTLALVGIALAILVIFLFSRRTFFARTGPRNIWEVPDSAAGSTEGWGRNGSLTGPGESSSAQPLTAVATSPARTLPSSPPRTLPSSPERTLPSSPPRTLPSSPAGTLPSSPPRTLPSSQARTLPSSPPRTLPSSPARTLPGVPAPGAVPASAAAQSMRPAAGESAPSRSGLTSTLGGTGSWAPSA